MYLYGIKPHIFRFYSSLFFMNIDSYEMNEDEFKDKGSLYFNSKYTFNVKEILSKNIFNINDFNIDINEEKKIPKSDEKEKKKKYNLREIKSEEKKRIKKINKNQCKEEILKAIKKNINSDLAKEILNVFPIKSNLISNSEYRQIRERKFMNYNNNIIYNSEYRIDRFLLHSKPFYGFKNDN